MLNLYVDDMLIFKTDPALFKYYLLIHLKVFLLNKHN